MRKLWFVIVLLLLSPNLFSQVRFEHGDFAHALEKAKKTRKTLFVYFYTDWCAPCRQLDTIVFANPEIHAVLNRRYIDLKLNAEKGEGVALNKKYNSDGYPTFVFIDSTGQLIGVIHGAPPSQSLHPLKAGIS